MRARSPASAAPPTISCRTRSSARGRSSTCGAAAAICGRGCSRSCTTFTSTRCARAARTRRCRSTTTCPTRPVRADAVRHARGARHRCGAAAPAAEQREVLLLVALEHMSYQRGGATRSASRSAPSCRGLRARASGCGSARRRCGGTQPEGREMSTQPITESRAARLARRRAAAGAARRGRSVSRGASGGRRAARGLPAQRRVAPGALRSGARRAGAGALAQRRAPKPRAALRYAAAASAGSRWAASPAGSCTA